VLTALSGCFPKSDTVFNDTEETDLTAESELPLEADQSLAFFNNYMMPPPISFNAAAPTVRGIYVTSNRAGSGQYLQELIDVCHNSDINSMVIDVRTEDGFVTFKGMEFADNLGVSVNNIPDVRETLAMLKENGIYVIARVVAFKDSNTQAFRPDLYIHEPDGSVWLDPNKVPWLNPYNPDACDYVLEFAKGAAEVGFNEIQFDYIRFAASARLDNADFGETGGFSRTQVIEAFANRAMETLKPYGVKVSADVYGTIISSDTDAGIVGQDYVGLARILDVICPMVYPSHYANGSMGLDIPDLLPYDTIYKAMEMSNERLDVIPEDEHRAVIRPWLQDFTATWLQNYQRYTSAERGAQIQGAYDAGLSEWLLWDPSNNYDSEGTGGAPGIKLASGGAEDE
jgi:hypothetical protein